MVLKLALIVVSYISHHCMRPQWRCPWWFFHLMFSQFLMGFVTFHYTKFIFEIVYYNMIFVIPWCFYLRATPVFDMMEPAKCFITQRLIGSGVGVHWHLMNRFNYMSIRMSVVTVTTGSWVIASLPGICTTILKWWSCYPFGHSYRCFMHLLNFWCSQDF